MRGARPRAARRPRQPRSRRRRPGRHALGRQPPAGRDRQGAVAERARPDHGRADRLAGRGRRAAADRRSCAACATRGVGIVYVSHRMPEIFALADRVTVLRDGELCRRPRPIGEVERGELVSMMVGRSIDQLFPEGRGADRRSRCSSSRDVSYRDDGARTSRFTLRAGEIVGHRRPDRLGPHRARADHLRHHAGDLRRDPARRQAGDHRQPERGARPRHRLRAGGPRPAGPDPAADHPRERLAGRPATASPRWFIDRPRRGARAGPRRSSRRFGIRARGPEQRRPPAVRRQPAEGRAGEMARRPSRAS